MDPEKKTGPDHKWKGLGYIFAGIFGIAAITLIGRVVYYIVAY